MGYEDDEAKRRREANGYSINQDAGTGKGYGEGCRQCSNGYSCGGGGC